MYHAIQPTAKPTSPAMTYKMIAPVKNGESALAIRSRKNVSGVCFCLIHRASAGTARVAATAARASRDFARHGGLALDARGKDRELLFKPPALARRAGDDTRSVHN